MPPLHPRLALAVLGAINWDTTIFEERFADPGEEVPALRVEGFPGGKGANAAAAAGKILGPGSVAFIGALGLDSYRGPLLESLTADGVRIDGVAAIKGASTGQAIIIVDASGRKTIHTHFGANDSFGPGHLKSRAASAALAAARSVVIMDVPLGAAVAAAKLASRLGSRVTFSPGVRSSGPRREIDQVLGLSDELVVDRSELEKMSGERDPRLGIRSLRLEHPDMTVVATLGPEGCIVSTSDSVGVVEPVDLRSLGLRAVNSTGSGDAFLAAYACYTMFGLAPAEAAGWGNLAGALKAASESTRGSPTRRELEGKMRLLGRLRGRPPGSR